MIINLLFCRIEIDGAGIMTHFADGTAWGACPHDTPAYAALAARLGYGDGAAARTRYCIEHEIAHSFVAQHVYAAPSRVIWGCAHGRYATTAEILHEEEMAISLQGFARAFILPGSSAPGFSWYLLREKFLALMGETS